MDQSKIDDILAAQARAAIYDVLAGLFTYHFQPDEMTANVIAKEEDVRDAADFLAGIGYRLDVEPVLAAAKTADDYDALTDIQSEYVGLFDRPSAEHALSPFEGVQLKGMVDPHTITDLRKFYGRFGLEPSDHTTEMGDHASMEFAFMSLLAARQAQALGKGEEGDDFKLAQGEFLTTHVLNWMPKWLNNLSSASKHQYFTGSARLAADFLTEEGERFGVVAGAA